MFLILFTCFVHSVHILRYNKNILISLNSCKSFSHIVRFCIKLHPEEHLTCSIRVCDQWNIVPFNYFQSYSVAMSTIC